MSQSSRTAARPRQTSFALWLVIISGVVAVLTAYEAMAGLHSLATREMLQDMLDEPAWSGTGVSVQTARELLRGSALITGAGGVAALILAAYCFKGDRTHRLVLTLIAVPVAVAGFIVGGFDDGAAVSAAMLWLQPSRAWFNGDPIPEPAPRATREEEQPPAQSWAAPDPGTLLAPPGPGARERQQRPPLTVVRAALLTAVFALGTGLVLAVIAVMLLVSPDTLMDETRRQDPDLFRQGLSQDQMVAALLVLIGGMAVWSALAVGLAVLVVRGRDWARICPHHQRRRGRTAVRRPPWSTRCSSAWSPASSPWSVPAAPDSAAWTRR